MNELQSLNKPENDQKPLSHECERRKSLILNEIRNNIIQPSSYKMKTEMPPIDPNHTAFCRSLAGLMSDAPKKERLRDHFCYAGTEREEKRDGDGSGARESAIENRTQPAISAADVAESLLT